MDKPFYIIGAGGHGAVVAEIITALGLSIAGFIDDNPTRHGQHILNWEVLGGQECIPDGALVALGIGNNYIREQLVQAARRRNWQLPVLLHPSAVISPSANLGDGTVVLPQVVVNARAGVGVGCILNTACSVDHDCTIDDYAHLAPGVRLAGHVRIGGKTLVGIGSCARPGITIGKECVIGAGAVLVSNLPDHCTAYGNPARPENA